MIAYHAHDPDWDAAGLQLWDPLKRQSILSVPAMLKMLVGWMWSPCGLSLFKMAVVQDLFQLVARDENDLQAVDA